MIASGCGSRRVDRPRNVVLISVDTCRADRLGCYGARRPLTPRIDAVAREGIVFEEALSPIPLTTPAHASMLTGLYPPAHGVRLNNGEALAESKVTLAEAFRGAGFQTAAFVGGFPLDAGFGLGQGFDTYDSRFTRRSETSSSVAERRAEEVATPAMAWLDQHAAAPFFLFVHFFDAHLPYDPPAPFASRFADDPYAGEIAYVDEWIGRILDRLHALKLDADTLLVITADHGESLGEHGEKSHGFFIYQSTQHVPLVIRAPGSAPGSRYAGRVGLVDLMPTLLDLAGIAAPAGLQGSSLRSALEGGKPPEKPRPLYCESLVATQFGCASLNGIVEGRWKYIRAPRPELYDVTKDPGEERNLVDVEPSVAERLRDRLEGMLAEMESPAPAPGTPAPDPDAVQRLQSLGYVGGPSVPGDEDPKDFIATYERLEKANALFHSGRGGEAEQELLAIVASRPDLVAAEEQLAQIARRAGRTEDAVNHCARIVAILESSPGRGDRAAAHFNLAFALREAGRDRDAVGEYQAALAIKPSYADAENSLGLTLTNLGRLDDAAAHFRKALAIAPRHAQAHNNLGSVLEAKGDAAGAVEQFAEAIKLKPDYAGALSHLAWIRATSPDSKLRNGSEAIQLAERACALTGRSVAFPLDALAAAYAESRRFDEAAATAREAVEAARRSGQGGLAAEIESRLDGYRNLRPYRVAAR